MRTIRLKKGLDVPVAGAPHREIEAGEEPRSVALLGEDFVGMKPRLEVAVGGRVRLYLGRREPGNSHRMRRKMGS